jgi:hypothetical protein
MHIGVSTTYNLQTKYANWYCIAHISLHIEPNSEISFLLQRYVLELYISVKRLSDFTCISIGSNERHEKCTHILIHEYHYQFSIKL